MSKPPKPSKTKAESDVDEPNNNGSEDPQSAELPEQEPSVANDEIADAEIIEQDPDPKEDASDDAPSEDNEASADSYDDPGETASLETAAEGEAEIADAITEPAPTDSTLTETAAPSSSQAEPQRGGWFGPFVAGAAAVAIGFAGAQYLVPALIPSSGSSDEVAELQTELASLKVQLEAAASSASQNTDKFATLESLNISDRLDALDSAVQNAGDDALSGTVTGLQTALSAVEDRISNLEDAPAPTTLPTDQMEDEAIAAFQTRLQDALTQAESDLAAAKEAAAKVEQDAATAEAEAQARAALQFVSAALISGEPYSDALSTLSSSGANIPDSLTSQADTGIPTLLVLQESYPDAARAALSASRQAEAPEGVTNRFIGFLQAQTGARSLTPREGDDADAVLSRAEAALRDGDLSTVLTELGSLPEAGQAAIADWIAQAKSRADAEEGVTTLQAAIGSQ